MTDFGIVVTKHGNPGVILANQLDITVNIYFTPADQRVIPGKHHQCLAHRIAEVTLFPVIER